jgi:hypothetical protein
VATALLNGGPDYIIELDTGAILDGFELDDAIKGVLDNSQYVLNGTTEFADITQYIETVNIRRGRQRTTDQTTQAGTCSFTMTEYDLNQELNPLNDLSIYYDSAQDMPGLAPMRIVRVSRSGEYLFVGRVTNYDYRYNLGALNEITVVCADDFYLLSRTALAEFTPSTETSADRLETVLARPEVAYTGATVITASPVTTLGNYLVTDNTQVATYINRINEAEQGRIFLSRSGVLTMQPRITSAFSNPVLQLSDAGNVPYNALTIEFDASNVVNRASILTETGLAQVATDATSIAQYFTQSVEQTDSLLSSDPQAATLAAYLLVAQPSPRYTSVGIWFGSLTDPQRDDAAVIDIGDLIEITKTETFGTVTQELYVEGVEHIITFDGGHAMSYYTSPTSLVYAFILDDPTYGVLDIATPQPALS